MQRYPAETYISGQKRLLTLIIIPIVVLDRGKIVWLKYRLVNTVTVTCKCMTCVNVTYKRRC